jgi:hypothetical protein
LELAPSSGRSGRTLRRRLPVRLAVAAATVLASLAVAAPAGAWPMCGW